VRAGCRPPAREPLMRSLKAQQSGRPRGPGRRCRR
jgi:hypothetical protein